MDIVISLIYLVCCLNSHLFTRLVIELILRSDYLSEPSFDTLYSQYVFRTT